MTVQPFEDGPAIEQGLYDLLNRKLYSNTDAPVTMRLELDTGGQFVPQAEGAMPTDVIGMPTDILDSMGIHPSAEDVSVFILKPKNAYQFHQLRAVNNKGQEFNKTFE